MFLQIIFQAISTSKEISRNSLAASTSKVIWLWRQYHRLVSRPRKLVDFRHCCTLLDSRIAQCVDKGLTTARNAPDPVPLHDGLIAIAAWNFVHRQKYLRRDIGSLLRAGSSSSSAQKQIVYLFHVLFTCFISKSFHFSCANSSCCCCSTLLCWGYLNDNLFTPFCLKQRWGSSSYVVPHSRVLWLAPFSRTKRKEDLRVLGTETSPLFLNFPPSPLPHGSLPANGALFEESYLFERYWIYVYSQAPVSQASNPANSGTSFPLSLDPVASTHRKLKLYGHHRQRGRRTELADESESEILLLSGLWAHHQDGSG